mmetsp:Transcript_42959/g.71509  ORF Transcript_42959/g.71509 Transcript_42959/m.71509 type:complete len:229 (-) Transcript_42959:961-1647(-)
MALFWRAVICVVFATTFVNASVASPVTTRSKHRSDATTAIEAVCDVPSGTYSGTTYSDSSCTTVVEGFQNVLYAINACCYLDILGPSIVENDICQDNGVLARVYLTSAPACTGTPDIQFYLPNGQCTKIPSVIPGIDIETYMIISSSCVGSATSSTPSPSVPSGSGAANALPSGAGQASQGGSPPNIRVIVAVSVIGGVLGLALIAGIAFFIVKRNRPNTSRPALVIL